MRDGRLAATAASDRDWRAAYRDAVGRGLLTCSSGRRGSSSARTSPSKSAAARRWRRRCSSPCRSWSCSRSRWCARAGVVADAAAGILWIAIAFSGTLALGRTFERERYTDTLRALLLAPADRPAIYVGKLLGILAVIFVAECLLVPLVALLFDAALLRTAAPSDRAAASAARWALLRSGRCLPRCWCARTAATSCCRCCCIRSRFQSSLPACAAPPR